MPTQEPSVTASHLLLASAGPAGADNDTHKASAHPWTTASGVASELREGMNTAVGDLGHAHDGMKSGTSGFVSATTLTSILTTWETRLSAVRAECEQLSGALKKAGVDFGENDTSVKESFDSTKSKIDDYSKGR
ncbi:hypothetical protein GCM10010218_22840 [Streptomyces mashuensis]|uniref:Uncharacterized protein n=1 Tax=Streptomyces mashuensis TaxID=33904 RepID=A0A919EBA3_9ACTN|nr:hypothetical protein [Streptomyces mashuensis]GHF40857.1 hypothetical protein GCM10010218_22840 [Streptomyces mashuensis]